MKTFVEKLRSLEMEVLDGVALLLGNSRCRHI